MFLLNFNYTNKVTFSKIHNLPYFPTKSKRDLYLVVLYKGGVVFRSLC